jgi:hypothetical protein
MAQVLVYFRVQLLQSFTLLPVTFPRIYSVVFASISNCICNHLLLFHDEFSSHFLGTYGHIFVYSRRRWEDNIRMDLREIEWEGAEPLGFIEGGKLLD